MVGRTAGLMKHHFHPTILRSYDIRGQVGTTLSTDDAFAIGAGFGQQIKSTSKGRVAVGRDGRLSSPELSAALIDGRVGRLHCFDIGVGPTPMLYLPISVWAVCCHSGPAVTTPDCNGFKLVRAHQSYFGNDVGNWRCMAWVCHWARQVQLKLFLCLIAMLIACARTLISARSRWSGTPVTVRQDPQLKLWSNLFQTPADIIYRY